jgi:prefoldin subunit 5
VKQDSELDAVKRKIDALEQEIEEVKARVKVLEEMKNRTKQEEKELERKGPYLNLLLANLSDLRKEKARLEKRQQQPREAAGIFCE